MPSSNKVSRFLRLAVLSAPLALAACGDGYEMVRVDDIVPYGNSRTAGTGVAYVRAKLLPQKELKLEAAVAPAPAPMTTPPPPAPVKQAPVPEKTMEDVFNEKQSK